MNIDVEDDPANSQYFAQTDDGTVAGKMVYRRRPGRIVLVHTETAEGFLGNGVAGAMAKFALDKARADGDAVVPTCPYVAAYVLKHREYQDILDPAYQTPA